MKGLIDYYKNHATENERFLILYVPIIMIVAMGLIAGIPILSNNLRTSTPSPLLHTSEPVVETPEPPVVEFNSVESTSTPNQSINITGTDTTIYINGKKIQ